MSDGVAKDFEADLSNDDGSIGTIRVSPDARVSPKVSGVSYSGNKAMLQGYLSTTIRLEEHLDLTGRAILDNARKILNAEGKNDPGKRAGGIKVSAIREV